MNLYEDAPQSIMGIDEKELKLIELIANGMTTNEVSEILNVEPAKANLLRKNLMIRTGTKNSASLVSFAYRFGLLRV